MDVRKFSNHVNSCVYFIFAFVFHYLGILHNKLVSEHQLRKKQSVFGNVQFFFWKLEIEIWEHYVKEELAPKKSPSQTPPTTRLHTPPETPATTQVPTHV